VTAETDRGLAPVEDDLIAPQVRLPRRRPSERRKTSWGERRPVREQRVEYRRPARHLRREVGGVGLLLAGLLILFASHRTGSLLPNLLRAILGSLVGQLGTVIVALGLMALGLAIIAGHSRVRISPISWGAGLLFAAILGLRQIFVPLDGLWQRTWLQEPGGVIGLLLAEALKPLVGRTWGAVVLVAVGLCALTYISEVPLSELARRIAVIGLALGRNLGGRLANKLSYHWRRRSHLQRLEKKAAPVLQPPIKKMEKARKPEPTQPPLPLLPAPAGEATKATLAAGSPSPKAPVAAEDETVNQLPPAPAEVACASGDLSNYVLPSLELLTKNKRKPQSEEHEDAVNKMEILEQTLSSFGIDAKVVEIERGPRVTRYEIRAPRGVRVSRITNLADDLAYSMAALDVRVEAPVPGKGVIGIEVPNSQAVFVDLLEILHSPEAENLPSKIGFALGKDITGNPRMADLAKMPHLLIAGATNSGKSVCLNTIIATILFRARPDEVKFLLIDPKRVELSLFSGIPHLVAPVAHDVKEAAGLLRWALREMEKRYELFADLGVRNIAGYNERARLDEAEALDQMCYLVLVIDELADLMMQAKGEIEASICRLAQLARATGIHLVVATQRPSVNVITGTIKANISSRIAFAVASQADSRVIMDINGAERLVGSGDMLYLPIDEAKPTRIQGAYISEKDINKLVRHLKEQAQPQYSAEAVEAEKSGVTTGGGDEMTDDMFEKALEYVLSTKYASASMLQRRLRVGYTRAARLIDMMEEKGYIGPADGSKPREVYVSPSIGGEA
jgi:DNA segregation ATPase FtsK/SpoIIIE, S-DNA-T family